MKEILFRGKKVESDEFVYGLYRQEDDKYYIGNEEVIAESISQYIGIKDNNDTKIFEGDTVDYRYSIEKGVEKEAKGKVIYSNGNYLLHGVTNRDGIKEYEDIGFYFVLWCEVVRNEDIR